MTSSICSYLQCPVQSRSLLRWQRWRAPGTGRSCRWPARWMWLCCCWRSFPLCVLDDKDQLTLVDSVLVVEVGWFSCVWAIGLCNYSTQDAVGYFFFFFSEVSSETMSYIGTEFTLSTSVDSVVVVVVVDSSLVLDAVEDSWRFSWRCCWWTVDSTS